MGEWLGVRSGAEVRYIAVHHILDVTFTMASADAHGFEAVVSATVRIAVPGQGLEVLTSSKAGARDLYRQVVSKG